MPAHIDDDIVRRVRETADADMLRVIGEYTNLRKRPSGPSYTGDCPLCHARGKFEFNSSKRLFNCWSCQELKGGDAITFVMKAERCGFLEAVHSLGRIFCIDTEPAPKDPPRKPASTKSSYCHRMLLESGLTEKDVEATVIKTDDRSAVFSLRTFHPGTVNERGEITDGDDVIIEYFDLDGCPVQYDIRSAKGRSSGRLGNYFRVRWQFPEAHLDREGKPFKYKSPYGSGTPLYIPQWMRGAYRERREIPRLYIQEGEKKAEKACKHGIASVAISGIMNLGCRGALPEDLVRIIRDCRVREVVFLMDSDWNDLSREKKLTEDIAKRPRNFFYAARNFKEHMRSLKNQDIYVEIYIGHVISHNGDKGIDDLLACTLRGREHELLEDLDRLINEKSLKGEYAQLYKITSWTDHRIEEIWGLGSVSSFADMHREELKQLPEFLFNGHKWKFDENGDIVSAQPFDQDEMFWEKRELTDRSGNPRTDYSYSYINAKNFLQNRGFGRYRLGNGTYNFIQVEEPFVRNILATDARDYLMQFAQLNCPKPVLEMLYKGSVQYLGPDKLSLLNYIRPAFLEPSRDCQYFYFRDVCWKVTAASVEQVSYSGIGHNVWIERKKEIPAKYGGRLIDFRQDSGGEYRYTLTDRGKRCHFLRFLENASDFTWRRKPDEITDDDRQENVLHLLSKLCAIGYMSMDAKDPNVARAVIAMDGRQSEVGESNGRSGKSLIGELMRHVTTIAYINGKKRDLLEDSFIWNDVTEKTRLVFIDDVLQSFNFEFLFPNITGDWTVNYKGKDRITFPFSTSPKLYIPTNHAIRGDGSSFRDRQWIIAFSDYYNQDHKPQDDFGQLFFHEWDYDQWNLTWNLIADCIQLYLQHGVIQAPSGRIEQRRLRQEITEGFILWADEYYSDRNRLNTQIPRKDLQESYFQSDPQQRKYVTPTEFKKRFKKYCLYKGHIFNPQMYDPITHLPIKYDPDGRPVTDDKAGGIEYFTVGTTGTNGTDSNTTDNSNTNTENNDDDPDAPF